MATKITCQTTDGSKSVSLLAAPYSITLDGIDPGEATLTAAGEIKSRNGERTTDADRNLRDMSWTQQIEQTTIDLLNAAYTSLKEIICQPQWVLVLNNGGAAEEDRYFDCYAATSVPKFTQRMLQGRHKYDVKFKAQPFARGAAIDLPRNWVKDPLMCEDFSGDGYPNSFVADDSATPATGTVDIDAAEGATKIVVTAGGAGRFKGIKQSSFTAANINEAMLEYKVVSISNGAALDVIIDSDDGGFTLHVTSTTGWTRYKSLVYPLGSANVPHIRVDAPNANSTATVLVRKLLLTDGVIPTGADGNGVFWTSEVAESPATMVIDNLPGDENVDALAIVQFCNTSDRLGGYADPPDYLYVGVTSQIKDNVSLVKSFSGSGSDSECIGGVYGSADEWNPDPKIVGRGLLPWRTKTTSTSATTDTHQIKQHSDPDWEYFPAFTSDKIKPFSVVGGSVWILDNFGTFELPTMPNPDDNQLPTSLDHYFNSGSIPGALYNDYLAFMPTEQYIRVEAVLDGASANEYLRIVSDSVSQTPNIRWQRATSGSVEFPFVGTSARHYTQSRGGEPLTLAQGSKKNTMLVGGARYDLPGNYRHRKTGVIMATRYVPRYLD